MTGKGRGKEEEGKGMARANCAKQQRGHVKHVAVKSSML